jgi:hypothetical protein
MRGEKIVTDGVNPKTSSVGEGINLLEFRPVRWLLHWPGFPYVFQAAMLIVFINLAWLAWGVYAPPGVNAKLFAKTHLATLLIWGIWWPAMIWMAVLLGRAWCMVCPLELAGNVSERAGRALGLRQRPLKKWVVSGVFIVFLYGLIQMLVAGAHINRVPAYTSWFLIGLLGMAFITGILFKDRAFCRGFCPVGVLLGTYGRGGMLAVRAGSGSICQGCTGKDCIMACNRTRPDARSCPSLLNPPKLNSNRDCLVCGQCIKSCQPDNMRLLLRRPFPVSDVWEPLASWPVTVFVMLVSGFVTWEVTTEWPAAEEVFLAFPHWASSALNWPGGVGWLNGVWALGVVPLVLWSSLAGVMRLLSEEDSLPTLWRKMALPLAVVVAAGHMAKGLAKFSSWIGFLPYALRDPAGGSTLEALVSKAISPPSPLLSIAWVAGIGSMLLSISLFVAIRVARLANPNTSIRLPQTLPFMGFAMAFLALVGGWAFLQ